MIDKIKKRVSQNDLILIGALCVGLGLVWNTISAMQHNYYLQQKYNQLQAEVELIKIKNQNMRYNIAYLKSDEYLEVAARQKFNKAAPGETLVYLPKSGEAQQAPVAKTTAPKSGRQTSGWRANLSDWWQFFQGNNALTNHSDT